MKYKDELYNKAEYYDLKKKAIFETIRRLDLGGYKERIDWDKADDCQKEIVNFLIDNTLQDLLKDHPELSEVGYKNKER